MTNYDPKKIIVTIGGAPVTGFAKDTFVEISPTSPDVTMRETLQGDGIFSINRDSTATVSLTVDINSSAHATLTALHQAQKLTGGGQFVFALVDANVPDGAAVFTSPAARVAQMPSVSYSAEASTVTYEILCTNVTHLKAAIPAPSIL